MKPNNNFNLTHSLLQTVREVVAQEATMTGKKAMPKKKEPTVMISHGKGGGVKVIPKSQYNPKIHDLADEKEPMAAPVAKVDAKKMDRRKVIAKTIEKKKNGIKLSGKAEFVDVRPKMNETIAGPAEVEQVDELSKATLGSYIKKASHDVSSTSAHSGRYREKATHHTNNAKSNPPPARVKIDHAWHAAWALHRKHAAAARDAHKVADKHFEKSWARSQGIAKATDKLIKKEEVEQVDELSSNKLKNYAISATRTHDKLKRVNVSHDAEASGIKNRTMQNRAAGIAKATDKLTKT